MNPVAPDNPSPHDADSQNFFGAWPDLLLKRRWVLGPLQSSARMRLAIL